MLTTSTPTTTVETKIPIGLLAEMERLVQFGWFRTVDEVILDALRRYLEAHRLELMEQFIQEDVEWGLYGDE